MPTAIAAPTAERALAELLERVELRHPRIAQRARDELHDTLAATRASAIGASAWRASCLTPSRYPVEVAFTSAREELRTVVDVVAPEADRRAALDTVVGTAERFGAVRPRERATAALRAHHLAGAPRFGAWLSSRHTETATRHKLYAELAPDPADAWRMLDLLAPRARGVLGGIGAVRFVGLPLDGSGVVEVYVRPRWLDAELLATVLARAGVADAASELVRAMAADDPAGPTGPNHAVSATFAGDDVVAVAGFTFAHHRYRRDHRVRAAVLERAAREHWPSRDLYAAASLPLSVPRALRRPVHTALSDVALAAGGIEHHVGLAPPVADATSTPTTTPTKEKES